MRRYSTRKQVFRIAARESVDLNLVGMVLAIAMLSGIFYLFSETAVYFSVLTPLVALLLVLSGSLFTI